MSLALPTIRIGDPLRYQTVTVFPLFTDSNGGVEYRLSDEALADESVVVEEVSESGSVPDLLVENKGETRVLFLEGEELIGAKQNRVLNVSVLVGAKSKIKIPVSCVEQGRWHYRSRRFGSSGWHTPSKIRYAMKRSVSRSLKEGRGHRSDQGAVWDEVADLQLACSVASPTGAMADAFEALQAPSADYRKELKYVEGATGVAVAIGKRIVAVDLFDKPATCRKVWDRLLSGCIVDALTSGTEAGRAEVADVQRLIQAAGRAAWEPVDPVGEGEAHRAEFGDDLASALSVGGCVVHESVMPAS